MTHPNFNALVAFVAVATHRSFRHAAIELGVSRSALSHALRDLEQEVGVRLLNRTTRSVAPTEAGQRLLEHVQPAFGHIAEAMGELNAFRETPSGTLRITAPRPAARLVLAPLIAPFLRAYPSMRLEISDNDALVDIVAGGFDAGVRFGERIERDMVAVPIGPEQRLLVVGSPAYFSGREPPRHPRELHHHLCIRHRFPSGVVYRWEFEKDGHSLEVDVDGPLTLGGLDLILLAALDGIGLAMLFEAEAEPFLREGRLRRVLEDWSPAFPGFFLYYPSRRQLSPGLRAFIDLARSTLSRR